MASSDTKACAVVGAGVVGICCAIALLEKGYEVTLYDPEEPGSLTSSGNAGGFGFTDVVPMASPGILWRVPGWLFDPCGPLFIRPGHFPALTPWLLRFLKEGNPGRIDAVSKALASILDASKLDTRELVAKAGLENLFSEKGALTVYKSRQSFDHDRAEWETKIKLGVEARELNEQDIAELEPNLRNTRYGWFTPQWCNTSDPFEFTQSLFKFFLGQGGRFVRLELAAIVLNNNRVQSLQFKEGKTISPDETVVAAGVWSKSLCQSVGERVLMESERGYNTTLPDPGVSLNHQVIFGEEKFVISNIKGGLRIGGAAEFSGLAAAPNYKRCDRLVEIARRYLPDLDDREGTRWMGHRPSTPDSMPVIGASTKAHNLHYAFGHGHYGLTMAATTGKLIAQCIAEEKPGIDLEPFSISRFA